MLFGCRFLLLAAMSLAAGCVDPQRGGAREGAVQIEQSALSLEADDRVLALSYDNRNYRLLRPVEVQGDAIATFGEAINVDFLQRAHAGDLVAVECALTQYGGLHETSRLGMATLEGYALVQCAAGDAFQTRFLYLPDGVREEIERSLDAIGGEAAESDIVVAQKGTILFLGRAVDGGILSPGGMMGTAGLIGQHPIVVEYWATTGRTYNTLGSAQTYLTSLMQIVELRDDLRSLSGR